MTAEFVLKGVCATLALAGLAGLRTNDANVRNLRPNLTILKGAPTDFACGTGTNLTRISNAASYEVDVPRDRAVELSESELLKLGYSKMKEGSNYVGYKKRENCADILVFFGEYPYEGHSTVNVSVDIYKLTWYGQPVPSPLGL